MAAVLQMFVLATLVVSSAGTVDTTDTSPLGKVLEMLSGLEAKIQKEGEEAEKQYTSFVEWCEERSRNVGFEITTGKKDVESLEATIEKQAALISSHSTQADELASSIAANEADLKSAEKIRATESASFAAEEKELTEVTDTLDRAIAVISREMQNGGASMVQLKNAKSVVAALSVMVDASAMSSADASRLTALIQNSQDQESNDGDMGAPSGAVYDSHSGGIIETLQSLQEKAAEQLSEARKKEQNALHNFQMLKQSLQDELKFSNKDLDAAKTDGAVSKEARATAEGDLQVTTKDLNSDVADEANLKHDCAEKKENHDESKASREEELAAVANAKKVISESTSGAGQLSYGLAQVSFLERTWVRSSSDLAHFEAVRFMRELAKKVHSAALDQLAARIASAVRASALSGGDPFEKVKGLISEMIDRLESQAGSESTQKAYCDEELKDSGAKSVEKNALVQKLTTSIDQMSAKSATLKEQVAALQKALADTHGSQAEMNKFRQSESKEFAQNKADMEQGIAGVQTGLRILQEYYNSGDQAHGAAEGAGASIVGLLQVCLSDFSKGLAEMIAAEDSSEESYDRSTRENKIEITTKEQDVKYKSGQSVQLDKAVAESKSDRSSAEEQLDAVTDYIGKLREQCVAKAMPYEDRKARREAEIAGLKQALEILAGQAAFVQREVGSVRTHVA